MVRENGDKVIFMENGEPELVVMSFMEYEKLAHLQLTEVVASAAELPRASGTRPLVEKNTPVMHDPADDMTHETEFMAPMEIAPIRTASIQGDQFGRMEREPARMSDIRLEDLPI